MAPHGDTVNCWPHQIPNKTKGYTVNPKGERKEHDTHNLEKKEREKPTILKHSSWTFLFKQHLNYISMDKECWQFENP